MDQLSAEISQFSELRSPSYTIVRSSDLRTIYRISGRSSGPEAMQDRNPEVFLARVRLALRRILLLEIDRHQSVRPCKSMMIPWTQQEDLVQLSFSSTLEQHIFTSAVSYLVL